MSDQEQRKEERRHRWEEKMKKWEDRCERKRMMQGSGSSHIWTGIFILLIGAAALLKASLTDVPDWVFSWQTFLIALGLFIGVKHRFRGAAWFILMAVGGVFLVRDIYPDIYMSQYIWPALIMVVGLYIILRPRHFHYKVKAGLDEKKNASSSDPLMGDAETWSKDDFVDSTSIFGGAKKNILSKDFRGGDIVNIFGGTELNLTQADIRGKIPLELTTIFGGTTLIVPSNWQVQSEAVTIFGGLEDKRPILSSPDSSDKILVLKGTVIFGGIEIKSY